MSNNGVSTGIKYFAYVIIIVAVFVLGFSCKVLMGGGMNIAVVDIQKVVNNSAIVTELKNEQKAKTLEMQKWLEGVQADIEKEKNKDKKEELNNKYQQELEQRRQVMRQEYALRLQEVDDVISAKIAQKAEADGYDVVLSKGIVLFGGKDITDVVIETVK